MSAPPPPPIVPEAPGAGAADECPSENPGWSRRNVLKLAGFGGATLAFGGWAYGALWRMGTPAAGKVILTADEFAIVEAIADAFFPGKPLSPLPAHEVKLADFVDDYLGNTMYEQQQRLYKLVFRALDVHALFRHRVGFAKATLPDRQGLLADWWLGSSTRRAAYQSVRWLFAMGYFEDFKVRRALGINFGCDLSERFPQLLGKVEAP